MVVGKLAVAPGQGDTSLAADLDDPAFAREANVSDACARDRAALVDRELSESERRILRIHSHLSVSFNFRDPA
jgi:hypothetical protein